MKKKYLVITDNGIMYRAFKSLLNENFPHIKEKIEFKRSPASKIEKHYEEGILQLEIIDVNKDCKKIIETYDLVFSIHCKQIFPKELIQNIKCINVHPGYNPLNRGWYPQVFAIIDSIPVGATIHEMDEFIDNGKIIDREILQIEKWETSKDVYERILNLELKLIKKNLISIINNNYIIITPTEEEANIYHTRQDFIDLCRINLEETTTFSNAFNRLRALTHGEYANAYFIDPKTGEKVFIRITLTPQSKL